MSEKALVLSSDVRESLRQRLWEEREKHLTGYRASRDAIAQAGQTQNHGDVADVSDREVFQSVSTSVANVNRPMIALIDEALTRVMDDEAYGQCTKCLGDIALKRLVAVPWSLRCLPCEEEIEQLRQAVQHDHSRI